MIGKKKCCCGGPSPCANCQACGDSIFVDWENATITDDNGTATYISATDGFTLLPFTTDHINSMSIVGGCGGISATTHLKYRYKVTCTNDGSGKFDISIWNPIRQSDGDCWFICKDTGQCESVYGCIIGFAGFKPGYSLAFSGGSEVNCNTVSPWGDSQVADCSYGYGMLTVDFTFADVTYAGYVVRPPSYHATLDVPVIFPPMCCQTFFITGCNGLPLQGATISVYESDGGALLAQGITPALGFVNLFWDGPCDVYVTVTEPSGRLTNQAGSYTLSANGTKTISMLPAKSGYVCHFPCAYPTATTLNFTHSIFGSGTVTYNSTDGYIGTISYNYGGCPAVPCAAATVAITIQGPVGSGTLSTTWPVHGFGFTDCPGTGTLPGTWPECQSTSGLSGQCVDHITCFVPSVSAFNFVQDYTGYTVGFLPDGNFAMQCPPTAAIPPESLTATE